MRHFFLASFKKFILILSIFPTLTVFAQLDENTLGRAQNTEKESDAGVNHAHRSTNEEPVAQNAKPAVSKVEQLLNQVAIANRYHSYEGLLTYEANGSLSTLRLYHYVDHDEYGNQVFERLEFLDGVDRHVVRQQPLASCLEGQTRWGLWPVNFNIIELKKHYDISLEGTERIASRETVTINFVPRDAFRYGYRFNVDRVTGLVLRSMIFEKETIVERTQFVSLQVLQGGMPEFKSTQSSSWRVPAVEPCHTEQFSSAWTVSWLPDGFVPAGNRITAKGEQVLIFTDGLVSISVFITAQPIRELPKITARRGATIAVISSVQGNNPASVAVVGEVPAITARRIAVSVKEQ